MRAVRFDEYGDVDVLQVREVDDPKATGDRVVVRVEATAINPGESAIRQGLVHHLWPATFPSGEGSDLAGVVVEVGPDVEGVVVGDEIVGWSDERSAHAELVAIPSGQSTPKPADLGWPVAGSLYVAGTTAFASVHELGIGPGDTVVVSAAAGGVGSLAVQLARRAGARVIGLARPHHHGWLQDHGIEPLDHTGDVAAALRGVAPEVNAFLDCFGGGYVELALELGVAPDRINTIIDFATAERLGTKAVGGTDAARPEVLQELAQLAATGELEVPIAATYPLDQVRQAYTDLAPRSTRGKRVLLPPS